MNFIILGDKFQKRRKTKGCPGLFHIGKDTIVEHQYKNILKNFNNPNIVYVYGFDAKRFLSFIDTTNNMSKELTLIYNDLYNVYNYAYGLYLAKEYLNDDIFILFGDSIIEKGFFKHIDTTKGSQVVISDNHNGSLGCILNKSYIQNIFYDLGNTIEEIYFLKKDDALKLNSIVSNPIYHNCFIFELINKLIDNNTNIEGKRLRALTKK